MASKTLQQTASQADVQDADVFAVARGTGALSHVTGSAIVTYLLTALATSTGFLKRASNLSDVADVPTARTNLGVQPTAAPSFTGGATVAGGLTVTGGSTVTGGTTITGEITLTGATVQNVDALAALNIDWSAAEVHTKSISANSTFTFSGFTASRAMASLLDLTISSAAVPTFPASVKWSNGAQPTLGNGRHLLGLVTDDGGTTVIAVLCAAAVA